MEKVEGNTSQLRFGGDIFSTKNNKANPETVKPILTGSEQIKLIDEQIKKEIPSLRIFKKGRIILAPTLESHFTQLTEVLLKQDAISRRRPQRERPRRFNYYTRVPVIVQSRKYHNTWTLGEDLQIFINPRRRETPRKLPEKPTDEIMLRLRQHTKLPN